MVCSSLDSAHQIHQTFPPFFVFYLLLIESLNVLAAPPLPHFVLQAGDANLLSPSLTNISSSEIQEVEEQARWGRCQQPADQSCRESDHSGHRLPAPCPQITRGVVHVSSTPSLCMECFSQENSNSHTVDCSNGVPVKLLAMHLFSEISYLMLVAFLTGFYIIFTILLAM